MKIPKGVFDTVCTIVSIAIAFFVGLNWGKNELTVVALFILIGAIVILWIGMNFSGQLVIANKEREELDYDDEGETENY